MNITDEEKLEKEFLTFINNDLQDLTLAFHNRDMDMMTVETQEVKIKMVSAPHDAKIERKKSEQGVDVQDGERILKPIISRYLGILNLTDKKGNPLVEVGKEVSAGQLLAVVETVNIKNEIKAPHKGIVAEILEEQGKPVEYGQILFLLEIPV